MIAPLLGESWSAAEGQGAIDRDGRRLSVSTHPGAGVVATGFPFRRKDRLPRYLPRHERGAGSASRTFAAPGPRASTSPTCGAGAFDGFFELGLGHLGHRRGRACSCAKPAVS